jgi:SAM-dependent methyltransferase
MMFNVSDRSYDNFMGRFSVKLAPLFADFAGALTSELVRRGADASAAEPSPPFVAALRERLPGIGVHEASAEDLPWPDESFDAALAQLVLTFMSDAPAGIAEMRRVVRPGGVVAVCMWDREGMELLAAVNRTQSAIDPSRPTSEQLTNYRSRGEIEGLFGDDVEVELLEVEAGYSGIDEFWDALADGAGPAGVWAASLDDTQRVRAREEIHRQLGEPAGSFSLTGRAWAARVTRA